MLRFLVIAALTTIITAKGDFRITPALPTVILAKAGAADMVATMPMNTEPGSE